MNVKNKQGLGLAGLGLHTRVRVTDLGSKNDKVALFVLFYICNEIYVVFFLGTCI